jgi:hypothetical protein
MPFVALACAVSTAMQPPGALVSSMATARVHALRQTSVGYLTVENAHKVEHRMRSEFRLAPTGFQECDELIVLGLRASLILLADHCVIQHDAAVLLSEMEKSARYVPE